MEDPGMERTVAQLNEARAEEARLTSSGLGERHPKILGIRATITELSRQLADFLATVQQSRTTLLQIQEAVLANLQAKFNSAKTVQIQDKNKLGPYGEAKSRYLMRRRFLRRHKSSFPQRISTKGSNSIRRRFGKRQSPAIYPSKPNVPAYMALAAIVGLVIGVGLAFFIEYLDTSVKTLDDVEKYLEVPVLAVIPRDVSTLIKSPGDTPDAEAYRILRANIEFNKPERNANTFTLVSGGPGEGSRLPSTILLTPAPKVDTNVLVVDADLRRPFSAHILRAGQWIWLNGLPYGKGRDR
jgi:hypothetical protein